MLLSISQQSGQILHHPPFLFNLTINPNSQFQSNCFLFTFREQSQKELIHILKHLIAYLNSPFEVRLIAMRFHMKIWCSTVPFVLVLLAITITALIIEWIFVIFPCRLEERSVWSLIRSSETRSRLSYRHPFSRHFLPLIIVNFFIENCRKNVTEHRFDDFQFNEYKCSGIRALIKQSGIGFFLIKKYNNWCIGLF